MDPADQPADDSKGKLCTVFGIVTTAVKDTRMGRNEAEGLPKVALEPRDWSRSTPIVDGRVAGDSEEPGDG